MFQVLPRLKNYEAFISKYTEVISRVIFCYISHIVIFKGFRTFKLSLSPFFPTLKYRKNITFEGSKSLEGSNTCPFITKVEVWGGGQGNHFLVSGHETIALREQIYKRTELS